MKKLINHCATLATSTFFGKTVLLMATLLSLHSSLQASVDVYYNDISGDRITKGASFIVKDDRFLTPAWRQVEQTIGVQNTIIFELDQYSRILLKEQFTCTITLRVDRWDANNDSTSVFERLTIGYNPKDPINPYQKIIRLKDAHQMRVTILDLQYSQAGWKDSGSVPAIFKVQGQIEVTRMLAFTCNTTVSTFTGVLNASSDRLVLNWSTLDGAEEYDLEWTFYDQLSDLVSKITTTSFPPPKGFNPIFENNATRITTKLNTHEIPMVYPNGYVFYRVRGARIGPNGLRQETKWSSQSLSGLLSSFAHKYQNATAHENTLNWQVQTTFAEDGKNAETVNYFDGSLRSRQQVTLSRADTTVLVQETIYDHQGRPAVQVMPTPPNGYAEKIEYYPFFARNTQATPKPYSKSDFDLDSGVDCNGTTIGAMSTAYGPAWYYSSSNSNSNKSFHRFIPDAEQYPFSVTEYTPDLTGRIKRQGGVGAKLRLGASPGRETQYFYAKPSPNELTRLFGTNVGNATHYQKNMVRDPNGQYSVSYLDAHGRTIATALAGNKPDSLLLLPLQTGQGASSVQRDLLNNVLKDNTLVSSYTLLVTNPGSSTLSYTVSDTAYREACMVASLCFDCYYDVKITVEDNCGLTAPTVYTQTNVPGNKIFDLSCSLAPVGINYSFSHNFTQVGEYQITKVLTPSKEAVDYYTTQYLAQAACVPKTEAQFLTDFKQEIDPNCLMTCATCKTKLTQMGATSDAYLTTYIQQVVANGGTPTKQDTLHARQVYDEVKKECNTICEDSPNRCESYYQVLLADVSPGGQYARTDNSANCVVDELLVSVLYTNKYKLPSPQYKDEFGKLDTIILDGIGYLPQDLPLCEFVQYWKPSWAKSLVQYHPEYCLYLRCTAQAASNTRDSLMWAITNYKTADSLGLFNAINNDPFFNGGGAGVIYKSEMLDYLTNTAEYACLSYPLTSVIASFILCDGVLPCTLSITSACKSDRDLYWQMFRNAYLGRKYALFSKYMATGCGDYACVGVPTCTTYPSSNPYAPKVKRWAVFDPYANGTNPETMLLEQQALANAALQENCNDNCEMVVDYWFSRMKMTCNPAADSLTLRPILKAICMRSCDATHPYGATTLPPGVSIVPSYATNVGAAIKGMAPGACDTLCNTILAGFPGPYEAPRATNGGRPTQLKPEPCVCVNLTKFKDCFNGGSSTFPTLVSYLNSFSDVKITQPELDSLALYCVNGCKAMNKVITLPPQLDCGICKPCSEISALKTAFDVLCPGLPTGTYNKMLTAYLNSKTGMQLTWTEYSNFLTKCTDTTNPACKTALVLCPRTPLPSAALDTACYAEQLAIAVQNAQDAYQAQLETLRKEFEARYLKACLAPLETFTATMTLNEYHYTLYFYDQANNLVRTVPPAGVNLSTNPATLTFNTTYKYECFNQVAEQTTPDGGTTRYWYDKLGRLVVSQDARQAAASPLLFSYSVYDALGRVIEVGEKTYGAGQPTMSSTITKDSLALTTWINFAPASLRKDVTRTYYDNTPSFASTITVLPAAEWTNLRKRVASVTFEATNDNSDATYNYATHYSYDIAGNVKILVQDIVELGTYSDLTYTNRFKRLDYDYDLVSGKVNNFYYQKTKIDQFIHRYTYDLNNRLTKTETSSNGSVWDIDASYTYYKHGPLARTILGQRRVQGLNYAYTLQGWLKGVNSSALEPLNDMGQDGYIASTTAVNTFVARDAFAFTIAYHHNDYKKIGTAAQPFEMTSTLTTNNFTKDSPGLFNGNIKHISQQLKNVGTQPTGYAYRYDQLNRLREMDAWERTGTNFNWNTATKLTAYSERIGYDPNGNIKTYVRNGAISQVNMDNLTYQYATTNNKLLQVNDDPTYTGNYTVDIDNQTNTNNYTYDAAGNMIGDVSQNSAISWSSYGKVRSVTRGTDVLAFGYDAMQHRVSKSFTTGVVTTKTFYIRDAQGNILATYELATGTLKLTELSLYGSARLGLFRPDYTVFPVPSSGSIDTGYIGKKQYELTNHLGNVLATVTDGHTGVDTGDSDAFANYYEPIVASAQEYYPFGMTMPNRSYTSSAPAYRYGFNGKEADKSGWGTLTQYDYGFRIYNPALGRFLSVDPIGKNFPWNTPYSFAENDVIRSIDLDGLEKVVVFGGADLSSTGVTETTKQTADDIQKFSNENNLGYEVQTFNVAPWNPSQGTAFDWIKKNYNEGESIILYGYSMGGVAANQLAKMLKTVGIQVDLLVPVDAAFSLLGEPLEIPDNVKTVVNYYQSRASSIGSHGYPAKPEEGNDKTIIMNYNMTDKTSGPGTEAHQTIDEDTQQDANSFIKTEMLLKEAEKTSEKNKKGGN